VKTKEPFGISALLAIFFICTGTGYAVLGVPDDVPGQDIVIPIICEGHHDPSGNGPISSLRCCEG
jgi:hypothetical protein